MPAAAACICGRWPALPPSAPTHICRPPVAPPAAAQIWEAAEPLGLRSKRFTKQMLQQLRAAGWVKTQPLQAPKTKKGHKQFGYRLNAAKQQQRGKAAAP